MAGGWRRGVLAAAALALAGGLALTAARADEVKQENGVYVLTEATFDDFMEEHSDDFVVLEFYAPWCGHCKNLAPEYEKAAKSLSTETEPKILLAKIDATVEKDLGEKHNVRGYPTLKMVKPGQPAVDYEGPRDHMGIVNYLMKKAGPAVRKIALGDLEPGTGELMTYALITDGKQADAEKAWSDVADTMGDFTFLQVNVEDFADAKAKFGVEKASAVALVPTRFASDHDVNVRIGTDLTAEGVKAFVKANETPLVAHLNGNTYKGYFQSGKPMLRVVSADIDYESKENTEKAHAIAETLRAVAKNPEYKDKFTFSVEFPIDFVKDDFGLGSNDQYDEKAPLVVIDPRAIPGGNRSFKYVNLPNKEYSAASVEAYIKAYLADELTPTLKSEPVPAEPAKAGEVVVVVGKNFDEVVMDETKDVLLEVYAPWCGHCKKLAPTYEELAKEYKDEPNVVIAKLDGTANDIPHDGLAVRGYPSLFWIPAGGKKEPQKYEGSRELDGFTSFINEKSTLLKNPAAKKAAGKEEL